MRLKLDALKQNSKPDEKRAIIVACCVKNEEEKSGPRPHVDDPTFTFN